jgi:hypothetical protein
VEEGRLERKDQRDEDEQPGRYAPELAHVGLAGSGGSVVQVIDGQRMPGNVKAGLRMRTGVERLSPRSQAPMMDQVVAR